MKTARAHIIETIESAPPTGLTVREITQITGIRNNYVSRVLLDMLNMNAVHRNPARALNHRRYTLTRTQP